MFFFFHAGQAATKRSLPSAKQTYSVTIFKLCGKCALCVEDFLRQSRAVLNRRVQEGFLFTPVFPLKQTQFE